MKPIHHSINYVEFKVRDFEISKTFYKSVFGWTFTDYSESYAGFNDGTGVEAGGFCLSEDIEKGGPLIVLYSEDLERTRQSVIASGGKISKETFKFPGGRRFQFLDPNGYELAVWSET